MSSILDIDLDYFNLMDNPVERLKALIDWGDCPIAFVVDEHHKVLPKWKNLVRRGILREPLNILHVDEHHDMMDEKGTPNIANFLYHAMLIWSNCRVHWLVEHPIDSPSMWLSDLTWTAFSKRFGFGSQIPKRWPKPQLISVCTSPQFVEDKLRNRLLAVIEDQL
jgi:hypothetical protein